MIKVSLNNSGGELDSRTVTCAAEAADAAIEMIRACGALYHGDKIVVVSDDPDAD